MRKIRRKVLKMHNFDINMQIKEYSCRFFLQKVCNGVKFKIH